MADAFISYVEEDTEVAAELAGILGLAGLSSWRYEADSVAGQSYLLQTRAEIEGCGVFVNLLSPSSLGSEQIDREVVRAHECSKPFLPLLHGLTYVDFVRRRPAWQQAMGAATAIVIPEEGPGAVAERIVDGLRGMLRPGTKTSGFAAITRSWRLRLRRRMKTRRVLKLSILAAGLLAALGFGLHSYFQRKEFDRKQEASRAIAEATRLLDAHVPDAAQPAIDRARAHDPHNPEIDLLQARLFLDMDEPAKALPYLEKRLARNASDEIALFHRGMAYSRMQRTDEALADLSRAIESRSLADDHWLSARHERGLILVDRHEPPHPLRIELTVDTKRDLEMAEGDFTVVYDRRGSNYALIERGRVRYWLGLLTEARRDLSLAYRRATESRKTENDPMAAEAAFLMGLVDLKYSMETNSQLGRSSALESFDVALRHQPEVLRFEVCRALARASVGYVKHSGENLQRIRDGMPSDDQGRVELEKVISELKKAYDSLPVQDLLVAANTCEDAVEGQGVEFFVSAVIVGRRSRPTRIVLRFYERSDSVYLHHWIPLRGREPRFTSPEGDLAISVTVTPQSDDHELDRLRMFLPYSQTTYHDGPQRYEFTLQFHAEDGAISELIDGNFSFTKSRR